MVLNQRSSLELHIFPHVNLWVCVEHCGPSCRACKATPFTPLLANLYRLNLGPWLAVDPVNVDLISVEDGVAVEEEFETEVSRRSPDIGLRLLKLLRTWNPFPFPLLFPPLLLPFPFPFPLLLLPPPLLEASGPIATIG